MKQYDFSFFPELETERLLLRKITKDDVQEVFEIRSNPITMQFIDRPIAKTIDDALNLIKVFDEVFEKQDGVAWAITFKEEKKLIGTIGFWKMDKPNFRAEIGYILNQTFHRKGIMNEALKVVIDFGFQQINLHSIEAVTKPTNTASNEILLKNGFLQEGYFRENYFFEGKFYDKKVFSLINKNETKIH